ncbi:hypothetical protein HUU62_18375 [Rhodoferax sp. 4810]|nr:hypothetical protein [Rhodoferax jenense]
MDNITLVFTGIEFEPDKVFKFLRLNKVRQSLKADQSVLFSRTVGQHKSGWMFTINMKKGTIKCSGGPTTTFFGFNAWVSLNESVQMKAIVDILHQKLAAIKGITFPEQPDPTVHRVEITHLYPFRDLAEINDAELAIYQSLVIRYPGRVQIAGATFEMPGVVRVGHTKSTSTLRLYPEVTKFAKKPKHVDQAKWDALATKLENYMRVETMYTTSQLSKEGLDLASGWAKPATIMGLVDQRMREAGLRGVPPQDLAKLKALVTPAPSTAPLRAIGNWMKGKPVERNGTRSAAQKVAKNFGFNLTRPFKQQALLAHGFGGYFDEDKVYKLPSELRSDKGLFSRWWEGGKA